MIQKTRRILSEAVPRARFTPRCVQNRWIWSLRRALLPFLKIKCVVRTVDGAKFELAGDPVDDLILQDILRRFKNLYFPEEGCQIQGDLLVLDVGAHHGFYAIEALRRYPRVHLIAVEPNPVAVISLKKNLRVNHVLDKVTVIHAAISAEEGSTFLRFSPGGSWGDTTVSFGNDYKSGIQVRGITIANILNGRKPNLIKCNAEGAEFVLFPQLFSMNILPQIVILMAHPQYGSIDELLELFKKTGYRIKNAGSIQKRVHLHFHCFLKSSQN